MWLLSELEFTVTEAPFRIVVSAVWLSVTVCVCPPPLEVVNICGVVDASTDAGTVSEWLCPLLSATCVTPNGSSQVTEPPVPPAPVGEPLESLQPTATADPISVKVKTMNSFRLIAFGSIPPSLPQQPRLPVSAWTAMIAGAQ
jgi:hypothetical protein